MSPASGMMAMADVMKTTVALAWKAHSASTATGMKMRRRLNAFSGFSRRATVVTSEDERARGEKKEAPSGFEPE